MCVRMLVRMCAFVSVWACVCVFVSVCTLCACVYTSMYVCVNEGRGSEGEKVLLKLKDGLADAGWKAQQKERLTLCLLWDSSRCQGIKMGW